MTEIPTVPARAGPIRGKSSKSFARRWRQTPRGMGMAVGSNGSETTEKPALAFAVAPHDADGTSSRCATQIGSSRSKRICSRISEKTCTSARRKPCTETRKGNPSEGREHERDRPETPRAGPRGDMASRKFGGGQLGAVLGLRGSDNVVGCSALTGNFPEARADDEGVRHSLLFGLFLARSMAAGDVQPSLCRIEFVTNATSWREAIDG